MKHIIKLFCEELFGEGKKLGQDFNTQDVCSAVYLVEKVGALGDEPYNFYVVKNGPQCKELTRDLNPLPHKHNKEHELTKDQTDVVNVLKNCIEENGMKNKILTQIAIAYAYRKANDCEEMLLDNEIIENTDKYKYIMHCVAQIEECVLNKTQKTIN